MNTLLKKLEQLTTADFDVLSPDAATLAVALKELMNHELLPLDLTRSYTLPANTLIKTYNEYDTQVGWKLNPAILNSLRNDCVSESHYAGILSYIEIYTPKPSKIGGKLAVESGYPKVIPFIKENGAPHVFRVSSRTSGDYIANRT